MFHVKLEGGPDPLPAFQHERLATFHVKHRRMLRPCKPIKVNIMSNPVLSAVPVPTTEETRAVSAERHFREGATEARAICQTREYQDVVHRKAGAKAIRKACERTLAADRASWGIELGNIEFTFS